MFKVTKEIRIVVVVWLSLVLICYSPSSIVTVVVATTTTSSTTQQLEDQLTATTTTITTAFDDGAIPVRTISALRNGGLFVRKPYVDDATTATTTTTTIAAAESSSADTTTTFSSDDNNYNNNYNTTTAVDVVPDEFLRIVGGKVAASGKYPSYGRSSGTTLCGATLIHNDIMITAAHCAGAFLSGVYVGGSLLKSPTDKTLLGEYISVVKEIPHPLFSKTNFQNDIMLIKLASVPKNAVIQRWNKDTKLLKTTNTPVTTIGFGYTREYGSVSNTLQEVTIKTINMTTCSNFWKQFGYSLSATTAICAGEMLGGKDSCQGDSGGPLLYQSTSTSIPITTLVGIVSYGSGCAQKNKPAVYTNVAGFSKTFIPDMICQYSAYPPSSCGAPTLKQRDATYTTKQPKLKKPNCPCMDVFCLLEKRCG